MRILDEDSDKKIDKILVYFTEEEAIEMKDSLELLLNNKNSHYHINSDDFKKEMTICIYNNENIKNFDTRSQTLIKKDE